MNYSNFNNKIAIITGGSEGIGFGISRKLAQEGAKVYLVARNIKKLEKARDSIRNENGQAEFFQADINDFDSIKSIIDKVYSSEQRLDIFVNNAGTYKNTSTTSSFDDIHNLLSLDFIAPLKITHYLIQKFSEIKTNHIKILTTLSQAALQIFPGGIGYGTAKMSLAVALLHYEKELINNNHQNIILFRLYPGTVATEGVQSLVDAGKLQNPTTLESVVHTALDLLLEKTPTRDVYIGYNHQEGTRRIYFNSDPQNFTLLNEISRETVSS